MVTFLKKYLPIILSVLLLAGVGFGIYKLTTIETKTVLPTVFTRGGVDSETGELVENKQKLVTRDLLECKGLQIEPSFDMKLQYQIFWYNQDKIYFDNSGPFDQNTKFVKKDVPSSAIYCRIVIAPQFFDEEGLEDPDGEIAFYEPLKYASKLKIKVNIKQDLKTTNLAKLYRSKYLANEGTTKVSLSDDYRAYENLRYYGVAQGDVLLDFNKDKVHDIVNGYVTYKFDCSNVKAYSLSYDDEMILYDGVIYLFYDKSGAPVSNVSVKGSLGSFATKGTFVDRILVVPENATNLIVVVPANSQNKFANFSISEYLPKTEITQEYYSKN